MLVCQMPLNRGRPNCNFLLFWLVCWQKCIPRITQQLLLLHNVATFPSARSVKESTSSFLCSVVGSDGVHLAASVKEVQGTDITTHKPDPFYRPQKVMFSQSCVKNSVHTAQTRQTTNRQTPARQTPPTRAVTPPIQTRPPPADTSPWQADTTSSDRLGRHPTSRWLLQRTVRILLECILFMFVHTYF